MSAGFLMGQKGGCPIPIKKICDVICFSSNTGSGSYMGIDLPANHGLSIKKRYLLLLHGTSTFYEQDSFDTQIAIYVQLIYDYYNSCYYLSIKSDRLSESESVSISAFNSAGTAVNMGVVELSYMSFDNRTIAKLCRATSSGYFTFLPTDTMEGGIYEINY